jgi:hypothetical protein
VWTAAAVESRDPGNIARAPECHTPPIGCPAHDDDEGALRMMTTENAPADFPLGEVLRLQDHVHCTAQTVHQAHHDGPEEYRVTWERCPRSTCRAAVEVLGV